MKARVLISIVLLLPAISFAQQEESRSGSGRDQGRITAGALETLRYSVPGSDVSLASIVQSREGGREVADGTDDSALVSESVVQTHTVSLDESALAERLGSLESAMIFRRDGPGVALAPVEGKINLARGEVLSIPSGFPAQVSLEKHGGTIVSSATALYVLDKMENTRELGLVYRVSDLTWVPSMSGFMGTLLVGLVDRTNTRASGMLDNPIPVQLLADPGVLEREDLLIERIGNPFQLVRVKSDGSSDPLSVRLISQVDPDVPAANLKVKRPQLVISAPRSLPGFGVGGATITVNSASEPLKEGHAITLELEGGWLEANTILADDAGVASTRMRSVGLGEAILSVAEGRYAAAPKKINYTIPWYFFVATLLGAMIGSTIFVYLLKHKSRKPKHRYAIDWWAGTTIGVGATVMAYAGMRLPEWIPMPASLEGELAPFGLAFICAVAGTALIKMIVPSQ